MRITSQCLRRFGACDDGIQDFVDFFGDPWEGDWTPQEQIRLILSPCRQYIAWLTSMGVLPLWDNLDPQLQGTDLSTLRIPGWAVRQGNFSGAGLSNAILTYCRIYDTDFRNAHMPWANLQGSDVRESTFDHCDLSNSRWTRVKACGTSFVGANVEGAHFKYADLSYADFSEAVKLEEANFRGAVLIGTTFPDGFIPGGR